MAKRSSGTFERKPRDFYPTPKAAVLPLLPYLGSTDFIEPCAGNGALVAHLLEEGLNCYKASDVEPQDGWIEREDLLTSDWSSDYPVYTNPPWDRKLLHPIIEHLRGRVPYYWLLIDANWMFTKQAAPYLKYCSKIVAIGRVKWIPDSKMQGKDDACWYCFEDVPTQTVYIGR